MQNKYKFGFIPLGEQLLPTYIRAMDLNTDLMTMHYISNSDLYNFLQKQINLRSQLSPDMWDSYLQDYWDKKLHLLIRFGFPLDYDRHATLQSQENTHASATDFANDKQVYIHEESKRWAILAPFREPPINNPHISHMITRI